MAHRYRKFDSPKGITYYVPVDMVNAADEVLADAHDPHSNGFGGSMFQLETVDGDVDEVKGPWHCTMAYDLLNICELKFTKVTILANASYIPYEEWSSLPKNLPVKSIEERFRMRGDILYDEHDWVMGHYARGDRIAHQLAELRQEEIWVNVESNGGGHSHFVKPGDSVHPMSMRTKSHDSKLTAEQNRAVFG